MLRWLAHRQLETNNSKKAPSKDNQYMNWVPACCCVRRSRTVTLPAAACHSGRLGSKNGRPLNASLCSPASCSRLAAHFSQPSLYLPTPEFFLLLQPLLHTVTQKQQHMLTKNHPATLQGTCQIFRTGAIHQSEAYHSYTPVPGPSVYTQHSTAGSVSGTRVSWPCPAPVIRHETL